VGREQVKFVLHPQIICYRSKFFAAASSERWKDSEEPIRLPEDSPETFNAYLKCIYQGQLAENMNEQGALGACDDDDQKALQGMVHMYKLSDKLGDLKTANIVIDALRKYCLQAKIVPRPTIVGLVCTSTTNNSPLRRLMCDYYVHQAHELLLEDDAHDKLPKEFLLEVVKEYWRLLDTASPKTRLYDLLVVDVDSEERKCHYHQHDDSCPPCEVKSQEGTVEEVS
jgi:hypothetical protein